MGGGLERVKASRLFPGRVGGRGAERPREAAGDVGANRWAAGNVGWGRRLTRIGTLEQAVRHASASPILPEQHSQRSPFPYALPQTVRQPERSERKSSQNIQVKTSDTRSTEKVKLHFQHHTLANLKEEENNC